MPWDTYFSFLLISCLIIVVPGPNVTLIIATSMQQGIRSGLMIVLGTTIAQGIQISLVVLGLTWLVTSYGLLFEIIRYAGVVYLIYLGIRTWRSAPNTPTTFPSDSKMVRRGFLVGLANPKSLTFFAAFFPQFIDTTSTSTPQFIILAISYLMLAFILDLGYAVLSSFSNRPFTSGTVRLWLQRISGTVLISGALLLFVQGQEN